MQVIVERDFKANLRGSLMEFRLGQIIKDESVARALMENGLAVREIDEDEEIVICPHCKRGFTPTNGHWWRS